MAATIRIHEGYARPIHETVVDGVPTFWIDDGEPFEAHLAFRVGRADESLLTSGISHLVEHLGFPPAEGYLSEVNGTTTALVTFFDGRGNKREVLGFLQDVCARLSQPPLDRLTREMRILREEASDFSPSVVSRLEWERFGARYLGVYDEPEYGMYRLTGGQAARWAQRFFTAGNAVLWLTGRPPRGFTLRLPSGSRRPPPQPPASTCELPAWSTGSVGVVGWSTVVENSVAVRLALSLARKRVKQRLRYELGISYGTWLDWYPLGPHAGEGVLSAGMLDGYEQIATEELIRALEELSTEGPSASELRWQKREAAYDATRPGAIRTWLNDLATDRLMGAETSRSAATWLADVDALAARDVQAALVEMLAVSILRTPNHVELPQSRYLPTPVWSGDEPVVGRRYNEPADDDGPGDQFIVGDDGVSYVDEDGVGTILFAEAAALVRRAGQPSGLYRVDGKYLDLENIADWPRGKAALRAVSEVTPRRLVIDLP